MSKGWHIVRGAEGLTLARQLPARFDVQAEARLPWGSPTRYAQQIRQDLWRLLQNLRGFSPVIRLDATENGWRVTAGGRVMRSPAGLAHRIDGFLNDPAYRTRWIAQAQKGGRAA